MSRLATKQVLIDLRDLLIADATVNGLVGDRIYPLLGSQRGARPYIVYNEVTNRPSLTHDSDASQGEILMQLDSYGDTFASTLDVADALRDALMGAPGTQGWTSFQAGLLEDEDATYEEDTELYRMRQDFSLTAAIGSELGDWLAADWLAADWKLTA